MDIRNLIGKKMIYFDGGLGSLLQAQGLQPGEEPERWNISHPDIVENVHFSYFQAGCHIVTTDSLGCNELNFPEEGIFLYQLHAEWDERDGVGGDAAYVFAVDSSRK